MAENLKRCNNCDRVIGRFERVYEWQGHSVCRECRKRLQLMTPLPATEEAKETAPSQTAKSAPDPAETTAAATTETPEDEETLWLGGASQVTNMRTYLGVAAWCVLAVVGGVLTKNSHLHDAAQTAIIWAIGASIFLALVISVRKWLNVCTVRYEVTTQRLRITSGILARRVEEVELYRVKDTALLQPFFLRLFKLAHVVVFTSDRTTPTIIIRAVPKARELRERIRTCAEKRRDTKRVREVDI